MASGRVSNKLQAELGCWSQARILSRGRRQHPPCQAMGRGCRLERWPGAVIKWGWLSEVKPFPVMIRGDVSVVLKAGFDHKQAHSVARRPDKVFSHHPRGPLEPSC